MKKTFSSKKSAFSLIELSIVLIIIGLLIAGITGGASLIKSSELRSVMSEAKSYQVAVNSFYTQYDSYPGDTDISVGSNSTFVGNRNNQIQYAIANGGTGGATVGFEGIDAWQDLRDIGAIDLNLTFGTGSTISGANASVFTPITNIPGSKIKGGGWAFDYNISSLQNVVVLTGKTKSITPAALAAGTTLVNNHFTKLAASTSGTSALTCPTTPAASSADVYCTASGVNFPGGLVPFTTPASNTALEVISAPDAYSIDSKVDDGKANSGTVLAVNTKADAVADNCSGSENSASSYSQAPATATKGSFDKYQTPNGNKKVCALSFSVNI